MKTVELRQLVGDVLKNNLNIEENDQIVWDSLAHIEILLLIDKRLNGAIANIDEIYKANNFAKLFEKLSKAGLLENK